MKEPLFGVYRKDRDDTPESVDVIHEDGFEFQKVPADEVFRGWDNLIEFLDESEHEYYWKEAEVDSAPLKTICSECGYKEQTRSDERVQHLRSMHHISTGH